MNRCTWTCDTEIMRPSPLQLNLAHIKGVTHISRIDFRSYLTLKRHICTYTRAKAVGRPEEHTGEDEQHLEALDH